MLLKIISLTLMTFLLTSCGEKKASSVVSLKLLKGSLSTAGTVLNGGILLMGRSEDGKNSFRTGVLGDDLIEMELAKGRWEFAAIAWQGDNGPMTGDNRCAYTGFVDLKDDQAKVSFDLAMTNCLNNFNGREFANTNHVEASGKFFKFVPVICMDDTPESDHCNENANSSNLQSYRIFYRPEINGQIVGQVNPLVSDCLGINSATKIYLPVTNNIGDNPLKVGIRYFKNSDCTTPPDITYNFDQTILDTVFDGYSYVNSIATNKTYFYANPGLKFSTIPVTPGTILFNNGVLDGGLTAYNTPYITFNVTGGAPANVEEFCATVTSCIGPDWKPIYELGKPTFIPGLSTDSTYQLKLFFKTYAGVIGSSSMNYFKYDGTVPFPANTLSVNSGIGTKEIVWIGGDNSLFSSWRAEICSDNLCNNIISAHEGSDFNIKSIFFTNSIDLVGVNPGTYYARVKTTDIFNRFSYSSIISFTISP
jgi:hypothetical protein